MKGRGVYKTPGEGDYDCMILQCITQLVPRQAASHWDKMIPGMMDWGNSAPNLLWTLLDGLVWRSRQAFNGKRRVNFYVLCLQTRDVDAFHSVSLFMNGEAPIIQSVQVLSVLVKYMKLKSLVLWNNSEFHTYSGASHYFPHVPCWTFLAWRYSPKSALLVSWFQDRQDDSMWF